MILTHTERFGFWVNRGLCLLHVPTRNSWVPNVSQLLLVADFKLLLEKKTLRLRHRRVGHKLKTQELRKIPHPKLLASIVVQPTTTRYIVFSRRRLVVDQLDSPIDAVVHIERTSNSVIYVG